MTREIRENTKNVQNRNTGVLNCKETSSNRNGNINNVSSVVRKTIKNTVKIYKAAVQAKRCVAGCITGFTEALADKVAREGLFGEDKGKGYCGTDVDYISD